VLVLVHADMLGWVEFMADYVLTMLGEEKLFGIENPLPWMDLASITQQTKGNFFETKIGDYAAASVMGGRPTKLDTRSSEDF